MIPTHLRIVRIILIALLNLTWITPSLIVPSANAEYVKQDVLKPYTGPSVQGVDTSTLNGKVMTGYQGWFNCRGDGAGLGWTHWARNRHKPFGPGNVTVDLRKISGDDADAYWFNPRSGDPVKIGRFSCSGLRRFSSPSRGVDNDWVLVLDEATQGFPIPGARRRN